MKQFAMSLALILWAACSAGAQVNPAKPQSLFHVGSAPGTGASDSLSNPGAVPSLPSLNSRAPDAAPAPAPRFLYGSSEDFRWQLAVGYEYVRFRSSAFDANLNGLHTSLSYYTNDWFAVEGSVVAAFGTKLFANETSRYLLFTGGPKIAWRGRKWEPWAHALFGGLHVNPQIAGGFSQNGFAYQLGGGADFRFVPQLSVRFEGDYVRSQLYSTGQNNFQGGAGLVFHF